MKEERTAQEKNSTGLFGNNNEDELCLKS